MKRTLLTILLLVLATAPLAAQDAPPRFFIERIEVRNADRVTPEVVLAEARLREGQEYSELELSDAAARLNRLPFLLSADFALERGSERGQHVLVITIAETRPFFFLLDIVPILSDEDFDGENVSIDNGDRIDTGTSQGVAGFRFFVGRRGSIHFGLYARHDNRDYTRDFTALTVGYTQYEIFGTRAFATLNLRRPLLESANAQVSPELVVGMPLSGNQTITVAFDDVNFARSQETRFDGSTQFRQERETIVSARWSYDTTNQPFLPTSGTLLSVTPLVAWSDRATSVETRENNRSVLHPETIHTRSLGIDAVATRYWELSDRNSVSAGAEVGWAAVDQRRNGYFGPRDTDHEPWYGIARAGFSHSLWTREERKHGDSRFDFNIGFASRHARREVFTAIEGLDEREVTSDNVQLSGSWVRRTSWGTLRLGVGYAW